MAVKYGRSRFRDLAKGTQLFANGANQRAQDRQTPTPRFRVTLMITLPLIIVALVASKHFLNALAPPIQESNATVVFKKSYDEGQPYAQYFVGLSFEIESVELQTAVEDLPLDSWTTLHEGQSVIMKYRIDRWDALHVESIEPRFERP